MAPYSKRDLLAGVLTAVGTAVNNVANTAHTLVGSTLSTLGTDSAQILQPFLTNNPLPNGFPWGTKSSSNTNYYTDYPITGVTRNFDWTVTQQTIAPDGVNVTGLVVNGQFPGPMIEANWGDTIVVTVHNELDEGTAIHWHGFLQKNSQPFDGVPGVSICPIAPGKSFTYTFTAELYGSSWWHSHYSSQYASGLTGPIVIHGPQNVAADIDLGPVLVTDWYHAYYMDLLDGITQPLPNARYPYSQNVLINGKNNFDCSTTSLGCLEDAGLAVFNLTSGKSHRVRLVNTAADATMKISLDDHTFEVIANDFVEIQPYNTTVVTLGIGQRSDVIIHANQNRNSSYWMRVVAPSPCANNNGTNYAQAGFYYEGADRSKAPTSTAQIGYDSSYCGNDPLSSTVPFYPITPGDAATTDDIAIKAASNGSHGLWYLDGVSAILDYNDPTLLEAKSGNTSYTPQQNVHNYGTNSSVRFIVQNGSPAAHPMHLHGHNMFVLAEGVGVWDGVIVNANNPQRRDVQLIQAGGYLVVQWNQDNPGSWPFHCHIAWHLSLGMSLQILEEPGEIRSSVNIPQAVNQVCSDWWSYTNSLVPPNLVDQIDSGI